MSAIAGGVGIGAGVGVSSVALAPFNAANTFMGSAFFGYGMILGERYMYQSDWPKIQQRLENGEKIENIIQEYTGTFTAVVMKEAKIIFDTVTREFIAIMNAALQGSLPPNVASTGLTPEEERRRSRGGGTTQPIPAPVQIPTVGGGIIPPNISNTQPSPTIVNAPSTVTRVTKLVKGIHYSMPKGGNSLQPPSDSQAKIQIKKWFLLSHPHGNPTITYMKVARKLWNATQQAWYGTADVGFTHDINSL